MATMMRAAFVDQFRSPLRIGTCEIPRPAAGQILVKTEVCGVCHTDLHAANGDWPSKPALPFIPGHESIGLIAAIGAGVTTVREGDRVGVPGSVPGYGNCEYCRSAWESLCAEASLGGFPRNGGFAEYVLADPNHVVRVPHGLAAKDAAPIICAGVTAYKGIKAANLRPGEWIAISGASNLGNLAIQYAKAMRLQVCVTDIDADRLRQATRLGADLVLDARAPDMVASVRAETDGGTHGVLVTATSPGAVAQGVAMTRKGGTCVLAGLPPGDFPLPLFVKLADNVTLRGSFVGTREDMTTALAFAADRKVRAEVELQPLASINDVLGKLARGDIAAQVVLDFGPD